jgi:hypothetical protein
LTEKREVGLVEGGFYTPFIIKEKTDLAGMLGADPLKATVT